MVKLRSISFFFFKKFQIGNVKGTDDRGLQSADQKIVYGAQNFNGIYLVMFYLRVMLQLEGVDVEISSNDLSRLINNVRREKT